MTLDWSVLWTYHAQLVRGAGTTVALTVTTMAFAIPFGLVLAFLRLSGVRVI